MLRITDIAPEPGSAIAMLVRMTAAGRHCHKWRVVGSGIKSERIAIDPLGALLPERASVTPCGYRVSTLPGSAKLNPLPAGTTSRASRCLQMGVLRTIA